MAISALKEKTTPRNNDFYRKHYHQFIYGLMVLIVLLMIAIGVVLYQMFNRPLPLFYATQPDGQKMELTPFDEPNLLPDTILRWATKAATLSYTFDFDSNNQKRQLEAVHPYFTDNGWQGYLQSVQGLLTQIIQNQVFVYGVVAGTPIISNQGPLPGKGYVWRLQIPFLVTYQSANAAPQKKFVVILTIVRVPTHINPQGIGIDQFVMV